MKDVKTISRYTIDQLVWLHLQKQETTSLYNFLTVQPDDTVLMAAAADAHEWLQIVMRCKQKGVEVITPAPYMMAPGQMAQTISRERVSLLVVSLQQWKALHPHLMQYPATLNRLRILVMDTPAAPDKRYMLIPRRAQHPENRVTSTGNMVLWGFNTAFMDKTYLTHFKLPVKWKKQFAAEDNRIGTKVLRDNF